MTRVVADGAFGEATWVEREALSECGSQPQTSSDPHPLVLTPLSIQPPRLEGVANEQ